MDDILSGIVALLFLAGALWFAYALFKPRRKCDYCGERHTGQYLYWNTELGKDYSFSNNLIFGRQQCLKDWRSENYFCAQCNDYHPWSQSVLSHKFKRDAYYFCSSACQATWKSINPDKYYEGHVRHSIPSDLRKTIWNRDKGRCVRCGSDSEIQYDHIVPVSKGGATTEANLELLCAICNLSKFDKIE